MLLVTSNVSDQLILINYIGRVRLEELARKGKYFNTAVGKLSPGFRVLADFSNFESMDPDCMAEIGKVMDLFAQSGIGMSVRVIPDSRRDPGVNILTAFHYKSKKKTGIEIVTCEDMACAVKALGL